ncbi:MAG: hypothetical protein IJP93_05475 [Bacteroidales bacterium]|nr:hypothetical protein [Bacteroidales bacterium]
MKKLFLSVMMAGAMARQTRTYLRTTTTKPRTLAIISFSFSIRAGNEPFTT